MLANCLIYASKIFALKEHCHCIIRTTLTCIDYSCVIYFSLAIFNFNLMLIERDLNSIPWPRYLRQQKLQKMECMQSTLPGYLTI